MIFHCSFDLHSLMISDVENLFHLLLCHLYIFFFAGFLIRLFCCNCSFLYILDVNILQDTTCKYFLLFHGLSRPSLGSVLWCTKVFNCNEVKFICFFFCCLCFWCHVQESLAQSNVTRLPPSFSSVGFMVLALMFRSSVHFELIFVCGTKVQLHYFAHGYPGLPTSFLEKTFLSPLGIPSVKNQSPLGIPSGHPCQKSFDYICEGLFLDSILCLGLYVCLWANTTFRSL